MSKLTTWLGGAFVALLLLATAGAFSTSSANAAELDTTTSLAKSMDALVSGSEIDLTNASVELLRADDESTDSNALNSAYLAGEGAVIWSGPYGLLISAPEGVLLLDSINSISSSGLPDNRIVHTDLTIDQSNNNSIAGGELGRVIVLPPSGLDTNTSPQSAAPGSTDGLLAGANTVFALAIIIAFILTAASLGVMHSRRREIRGGEASSASGRPFSD